MGPLKGLRVIEMAGIGPAPFCGMMLADMGAEVVSVQRLVAADLGFAMDRKFDFLGRGKRAVAVDLKSPDGVALVLDLVAGTDVLIEGFRPGVMERLGLGPEVCAAHNPALVFGRMTGWGQSGPMRNRAGHDINYLSMTGALDAIGPAGQAPVPPLNLVADFGGGAMYLLAGVLAAVIEARQSGLGQTVDAAMVDGVGSLMSMTLGMRAAGLWDWPRGQNALDGGAPWYTTYLARDGGYLAVGAIEARFYQTLLEGLGLQDADLPGQHDRAAWPRLRAVLAAAFLTRDRDDWAARFAGTDGCVTPVLTMEEARAHAIAVERDAYQDLDGIAQPRPAPRFSRTDGAIGGVAPDAAATTGATLGDWGIAPDRIAALERSGAIAGSD